MFKIAVDLGYGFVKGINEFGKTVLIRTAVGTGSDRQLANLFGNPERTKEHIIISQNGAETRYYIGDLARRESRSVSSPFEKNKIDNPSTKILLAAAYAMLTDGNTGPVHLVTGPPLLYAKEQRESFEKSLTGYHATLQFVGSEKFYIVKFDKVTVFPQGAAVVYDMLKKNPELAKPGKTFVIVEIGYKTTEILMFRIDESNRIAPISDFSTTLELGMSFVEKAIDEEFFQKTGSKLIPSAIDRIMSGSPTISFRGREIALEDARNRAKDELVRNIIDGVSRVLGEQIDFIDKLIFAGGVVSDQYIADRLKALMKTEFTIIEDSQFANARGMLEVARLLEAKGNVRTV